ncbi:hypothetical protein BKA80DRAFT_312528 [Phyllosticta citrichinensis]
MDPQPESGSTKVWRKNPAHPYAAESQKMLAWTWTERPNGTRDWSIADGPNGLIPQWIMNAKEPTKKACQDMQIQQADEPKFMIELLANAMLHLKIFFPELKAWDILEGETIFKANLKLFADALLGHLSAYFLYMERDLNDSIPTTKDHSRCTYPVTVFFTRHRRAEHMGLNLGSALLSGCAMLSRDQHAARSGLPTNHRRVLGAFVTATVAHWEHSWVATAGHRGQSSAAADAARERL